MLSKRKKFKLFAMVAISHAEEETSPVESSWWEAGGASGALQILQPKGAPSYAASLLDLSGNGNNASEGSAPAWDAVNGWQFNGTTNYLNSGILPDGTTTVIVRYSDLSSEGYVFGAWNAGSNTELELYAFNGVQINPYWGDGFLTKTAFDAGVYAIASNECYRNGVSDGSIVSTWSGTPIALYIGASNWAGSDAINVNVDVQAWAIYDNELTSDQVAAVSAAMATL